MVRPAQKLTSVLISTVDIGDTISYDLPQERGLYLTRKGRVHSIEFDGKSRFLFTQEKAIIAAWQHGKPEPRVFIIEHAPQVQSVLEIFNER